MIIEQLLHYQKNISQLDIIEYYQQNIIPVLNINNPNFSLDNPSISKQLYQLFFEDTGALIIRGGYSIEEMEQYNKSHSWPRYLADKIGVQYKNFGESRITITDLSKVDLSKTDRERANSTEIKKRDTEKVEATEIQQSSTRKGGDVWMVNNQIDVVSSESNLYYDM